MNIQANIVSVKEAAEILGVTQLRIRCGLRAGVYPFGTAVDMSGKGRYTYTIFRNRLIAYNNAQL